MGAERKLRLCHYLFAVWLICSLCHVWAAINKKSCWQENLDSLIQLWNDLKFNHNHKSRTNTQNLYDQAGLRTPTLKLGKGKKRCFSTQGHIQVHFAAPAHCTRPHSFALFCLWPTLAGSLPFFRGTPAKGIPRGWLTQNTSCWAAQTGPQASGNDTHARAHAHTHAGAFASMVIKHTIPDCSLHQLCCRWWSGAEGKEAAAASKCTVTLKIKW